MLALIISWQNEPNFPRDFKGGNPVVQPSNDVDGAAHGIGEKQFYPPSAIQNPQ
jgi:hypothetical protein